MFQIGPILLRHFPFKMPKIFLILFFAIFLQFFGIFVESTPIRHSPSKFSPFRQIRQSQSQPILGKLAAPIIENLRQFEENAVPPHCSRATVTLAHSSKLTKRSAASNPLHPNSSAHPHSPSTQLSLNIGIGQTVCFTASSGKSSNNDENESSRERRQSNEEEEDEGKDEVLTVPKSNFSFIVELAREPKRTAGRSIQGRKDKIAKKVEEFPADRVLHSISVLDLEQFHAITERYRFAIPELETRCICECESGTANCVAARYKYGRCGEEDDGEGKMTSSSSSGSSESAGPIHWAPQSPNQQQRPSVCHRTFFANQPTGRHCSKHGEQASSARLCCQLRFRPHRGRAFSALRLENAVSSVLLQYSQWAWREEVENATEMGARKTGPKQQHWRELERRKVRIQLDGAVHNTVLSESAGLKLSVLGLSGAKSAAAQLEPGIYFAENQPDGTLGELAGQMPVNRITEHDFHKLGWFRLDERGQPFVQSGEVFLDRIHHARVDDCAEQRFRSVLDASYYVNGDNNASIQFKMADPLSNVHKWIRSARVLDSNQRIALVRAREGLSLEVTLTTGGRNGGSQRTSEAEEMEGGGHRRRINFVHNSSRLTDFTAMLVIDRFSNSMLNLMLFNASGILNGYVRPLNELDAEEIDGFSVNVPSTNLGENQQNSSTLGLPISLQVRIRPYPLGSIHVVCLRPDDAESIQELCRPVQSVYHELEVNTVKNEWNEAIGECKKCNQISAEGFAKYLNPANWTKGISSVSDALMLIFDLIGYFIAFLILWAFLSKVVFPLLGCCCTGCLPKPASIFCKNSNKK